MTECWKNEDYSVIKEKIIPLFVKRSDGVANVENLLVEQPACIAFYMKGITEFTKKGAFVILDFGKELCGSLRLVTRAVLDGEAKFRITLGESLAEACSSVGEKNATNEHSPRDFVVDIPSMSDMTFGSSGFRFARLELLTDHRVLVQNIFAINTLPMLEKEGYITTSDEELNKIIETAIYTLKLNLQNGYIWDGIKRDRLIWCGDLNPEILTSIYLFGDHKYITNSLSFLRDATPMEGWMNWIPTYSAWWVINLCDYCRLTGNTEYFEENKLYARAILEKFNGCINEEGNMDFHVPEGAAEFFLDWPTYQTDDAVIGTASLLIYAANVFLQMEEDEHSHAIICKLKRYLEQPCVYKQTRAFQILAGRDVAGDVEFLEQGGAEGYSTFMSYYILSASAKVNGKDMLSIIKEYFGAMLSRGATTFWEDFHMDWLEGSGRIDEFPKEGEKDIHGDYGAFCYQGFRHSLCHGWACGVLAFIYEYMLGLKLSDGGETYEIKPNPLGVKEIHAKIPTKTGWLGIDVVYGNESINELSNEK